MNVAAKELFKKEFKSYFLSPLGPVFIVIFLFGLGHLAFEPGRGSFFLMREASLHALFSYMPWMMLFLVPAVTMRLWSEEKKSGTIELLFSLPLSVSEAVIAKFLAAWAFVGVAILGTLPMVGTVLYLGSPDLGVIFLGYLASFLLAGPLIAIGGFFSALGNNQVVSFILTAVVGTLLMMIGSPPVLNFLAAFFPKFVLDHFESLGLLGQFESIEKGVISLANIWFFTISIGLWIFANIVILDDSKS